MIKHANIPARIKIAGTAITATYQTVGIFDDDLRCVFVFNSCDAPIIISLDGGITDHFELDQEGFDIDLRALSLALEKPTISVKYVSAAPTTGSLRVTGIK